MSTTPKTGSQVVEDFVRDLVTQAQAQLQSAQQQLASANTDSEKAQAVEAMAQAQVDLAVAQAIKDLADKGQLTEKRLQSKLKALRGK